MTRRGRDRVSATHRTRRRRGCACAPSRSSPELSCSSTSSPCRTTSATSRAHVARGRGAYHRHDGARRAGDRRRRRRRPGARRAEAAERHADRQAGLRRRARTRPRRAWRPRGRPPSISAGRSTRCSPARARCAGRPARRAPRAARQGAGDPRRRHRPLSGDRRARRGAFQGRRPHPHALQRRRPGDCRLRHGARRHPVRAARYRGISVFVDETRPWLQGARLTAWELGVEGIPYTLISDNMAGHFISRGEIDGVVVGADRIAANGDTANKIGTYTLSVLAKEHDGAVLRGGAAVEPVDLERRPRRRHPHRRARGRRGHVVARAAYRAARVRARVTPPSTSRRPPTSRAIITEAGVLRAPYGEALRAACEQGRCLS